MRVVDTWILFVFALSGLMYSACYNQSAAGHFATLPKGVLLEPLERTQYSIEGNGAAGRDCADFISLFPLPFWFVTSDKLGTQLFSFASAGARAEQGAIYDALEKAPQADFLMSARVRKESSGFGPWWGYGCYELQARTARLKSDSELRSESVEVDVKVRKSAAR